MFINYQFMNLSQKYALKQCLSECLSHKSYYEKEVRMAIRPPVTHPRIVHRIALHCLIWKILSDLRIILFIRELILNIFNVHMPSARDAMCLQRRYRKIKLLDFSVNVLRTLSVIISPDESRGYIGFRSVAPPPP